MKRFTTPALIAVAVVVAASAAVLLAGKPAALVGPPPGRTTSVHLFEWRWDDIAQECEQVLGPKGYAAVQVSPPQEHVVLPGQPWYERYQPVSYRLASRSGTRAQFAEMVARCNKVGVQIHVDAVINHMSWARLEADRGSGGSPYDPQQFSFPAVPYTGDDFHHCRGNGNNEIKNWSDKSEIWNCQLANLEDLATEKEYVRARIAAYLQDLLDLGVAGFRIDAAKHIPPDDLANIFGRLKGNFLVYQEVPELGLNEAVKARDYFTNGRVIEFKYAPRLAGAFRDGDMARLQKLNETGGLIPSDKALVWVDNHDTQRTPLGGPPLTYKDGNRHTLASVFMLAWPYGYPQVMSSYAFTSAGQGPPAGPDGRTKGLYNGESACGKEWVCEHRERPIANMVAFRNYAANVPVSDFWTGDDGQVAFGRLARGFVVFNAGETPLRRSFETGLPAGTYCDVIHGDPSPDGRCSGPTISVDGMGRANITAAAGEAVAIHVGAQLGLLRAPPQS